MKATAALISTSVATAAATQATESFGLAEYGTSWPIIIMAIIGAITAIPDFGPKTRKAVAGGMVLALSVGALGGPVAAEYVGSEGYIDHPALPLLFALLLAHFANDLLHGIVDYVLGIIAKRSSK